MKSTLEMQQISRIKDKPVWLIKRDEVYDLLFIGAGAGARLYRAFPFCLKDWNAGITFKELQRWMGKVGLQGVVLRNKFFKSNMYVATERNKISSWK